MSPVGEGIIMAADETLTLRVMRCACPLRLSSSVPTLPMPHFKPVEIPDISFTGLVGYIPVPVVCALSDFTVGVEGYAITHPPALTPFRKDVRDERVSTPITVPTKQSHDIPSFLVTFHDYINAGFANDGWKKASVGSQPSSVGHLPFSSGTKHCKMGNCLPP
jgi:hypothetical protein